MQAKVDTSVEMQAPQAPAGLSRSDTVVAVAVFLVCGLAAFVGMPPLRLFAHDIFFALDNAYRVCQGQVPHRDFASAWGPLIYLIHATGLLLSGMRPAALAYANALFAAPISLWAYWTARNRMAAVPAFTMSVYTALLIVAPFALGFLPTAFTFAMVYNRYGYALLGIIVVECGLQSLARASGNRQAVKGAASVGVAWALLAFLKITCAIAAVPFLAIAAAYGTHRKKRLAALCAGAGGVTVPLLAYLRFDLPDMVRDLAAAASGRSHTWVSWHVFNADFVIEGIPLVLLAAATVIAREGKPRDASERALLVAATLAVGSFLVATNQQPNLMPLNAYAALVLGNAAVRAARAAGGLALLRRRLILVLMGLNVLPILCLNAGSLLAATARPAEPALRFASLRGASIVFDPLPDVVTSERDGPRYVAEVNEGLQLIRRRTEPAAGVLTLDMFNPFNYLLNRPSPCGGMSAAAYNYTFSDTMHPTADRYFGDALYVLVRKYSLDSKDFDLQDYFSQGLLRIYLPGLRQRFSVIEETPHWVLWRRSQ
jgi:hypothetical protein